MIKLGPKNISCLGYTVVYKRYTLYIRLLIQSGEGGGYTYIGKTTPHTEEKEIIQQRKTKKKYAPNPVCTTRFEQTGGALPAPKSRF